MKMRNSTSIHNNTTNTIILKYIVVSLVLSIQTEKYTIVHVKLDGKMI